MRLWAIPFFLLLAGCGQSFDERYEETEKELVAKAREMDRQLEADGAQEETARDQPAPSR